MSVQVSLLLSYPTVIDSHFRATNIHRYLEGLWGGYTRLFRRDSPKYTSLFISSNSSRLVAAPAPRAQMASQGFYQDYWATVTHDIIEVVSNFLVIGELVRSTNGLFLALIPMKNSQLVTDLRRIALCNSIYKIISKLIVESLKSILNRIIDRSQVAFLLNRGLVKNVIISHETVHSLGEIRKELG
ncbi:Transposon TX1 uncharacterized protein [Nymphaea thermarum]|nr:Transposon TX1 uncharacterized protein [Nymphaea thermarum]